MIRSDCFGSDDEQLDDVTIEMILDIITLREQGGEQEVNVNVLWENFQDEYAVSVVHPTSTITEKSKSDILLHKRPFRVLRYILVAALLCLVFGNCVVFATGGNFFDSIAKWTEETFHFETNNNDNSNIITPVYQSELEDEIITQGD